MIKWSRNRRREFLKIAGSWTAASFLLNECNLFQKPLVQGKITSEDCLKDGFLEVELNSNDLEAVHSFYANTLGMSVEASNDKVMLLSGGTKITFLRNSESRSQIYHLAWAIPAPKFYAAKRWLSERTALLLHPDGRDEFEFTSANRKAIYFTDPSGNILELIARYNLSEETGETFG